MIFTIDTTSKSFTVTGDDAILREYPLFGPEAFQMLSRQWVIMGWNLRYFDSFSWMGRQIRQFPDDLFRLAEMLWRVRPDVVVETGLYEGGSALWFANFARVISVELKLRPGVLDAVGSRLTVIEADSASPDIAARVAREIRPGERVCVFLDSDHSESHVAAELEAFAPLVSSGCYLIVADSILPDLVGTPNGKKVWLDDHPGVAVDAFLESNPEFKRERQVPLFPGTCDFGDLSYFRDTWLRRL